MSGGGSTSSTSARLPGFARKYAREATAAAADRYANWQPPPSLYTPMDPRRQQFLEGRAPGMVNAALSEYERTLGGEYLHGSPHLDTIISRAMDDAQGRVGGSYGTSGRFGGGQWSASLADALVGTSAGIREKNYQLERDRMLDYGTRADQFLATGEYIGGAFEEDEALRQEEAYRQYLAPEENLDRYLSRIYATPVGQRTTTSKDMNWVDYLGAILGAVG